RSRCADRKLRGWCECWSTRRSWRWEFVPRPDAVAPSLCPALRRPAHDLRPVGMMESPICGTFPLPMRQMTLAMKRTLSVLLVLLSAVTVHAQNLELNKGEHICLVGNTLAERMQFFGNLETRLTSRLADQELVFRNLGYAADEITTRLRSMDFG